jgi:hypothetical protein
MDIGLDPIAEVDEAERKSQQEDGETDVDRVHGLILEGYAPLRRAARLKKD